MVKVTIKPYKLEWIIPPVRPDGSQDSILIQAIGRRGSGKSTLLRNIMYVLKDQTDFWILVTLTSTTEREWRKFAHSSMIHRSIDKAQLRALLDEQDAFAQNEGKRRKVVIVWDDVQSEDNALTGEEIKTLFLNGRHLDITFVTADQYCMGMKPILRNQVDIVFNFFDDIPENVEKLRKYYAGKLPRQQFYDTFLRCTNPDGDGNSKQCFIVDRIRRSFFTYTAVKDLPDFRLGSAAANTIADLVGMSDEEIKAQRSMPKNNPAKKDEFDVMIDDNDDE